MPKVNITPRKLVKILQKEGFVMVRQNGSHAIFRHFAKNRKVIMPMHNKDIPTGTAHAIIKDAGITL